MRPQQDDVITAYESDSSVVQGDLGHDAVTKVFGRDSRGRHLLLPFLHEKPGAVAGRKAIKIVATGDGDSGRWDQEKRGLYAGCWDKKCATGTGQCGSWPLGMGSKILTVGGCRVSQFTSQ
ncbi:hypothetical protein AAC387_Pa03g1550 [Persea americana]